MTAPTHEEAERAVGAMYANAAAAMSLFIASAELDFARAAAVVALRLAPDEAARSRLYEMDPRPFFAPENVALVAATARALLAGRVTSETSH